MVVLVKSLPKVGLVHALRRIAEILSELEDEFFPNLRVDKKIDGMRLGPIRFVRGSEEVRRSNMHNMMSEKVATSCRGYSASESSTGPAWTCRRISRRTFRHRKIV